MYPIVICNCFFDLCLLIMNKQEPLSKIHDIFFSLKENESWYYYVNGTIFAACYDCLFLILQKMSFRKVYEYMDSYEKLITRGKRFLLSSNHKY